MTTGPDHVEERRLRLLSARLALGCAMMAALLPLLVLAGLAAGGPSELLSAATGQPMRIAPGGAELALGLALALVPACLLSAGFLAARLALRAFAAGAWVAAAPALRAFGRWTALAGVAGMGLPTALGLALMLGAPPGERVLAISVNSGAVTAMLTGAVIWAVGHVWARTAALRAELDAFV